jgi:hypothetical protein
VFSRPQSVPVSHHKPLLQLPDMPVAILNGKELHLGTRGHQGTTWQVVRWESTVARKHPSSTVLVTICHIELRHISELITFHAVHILYNTPRITGQTHFSHIITSCSQFLRHQRTMGAHNSLIHLASSQNCAGLLGVAATCVATLELPTILWNSKIHYRIHRSPPLVPILSHNNPLRTILSHLMKTYLNTTHSSTS